MRFGGTVSVNAYRELVMGSRILRVQRRVPPSVGGGINFLANHNFDDGTYGPYSEFDVDAHVDITADPTGAGRGQVVRYHYQGANQDRNRSVEWDYPAGIHLGQTLYHRHYVHFPSPLTDVTDAFIGRKWLYWQGGSNIGLSFPGVSSWAVIGCDGMELSTDIGHFNNDNTVTQDIHHNISAAHGGNIQPDRWYRCETQMTMNSTMSSNDAIWRVWIDDVLFYEITNWRWTDPAWDPAFDFDTFFVGDQLSWTSDPVDNVRAFDELRYVDKLAFATSRIGA